MIKKLIYSKTLSKKHNANIYFKPEWFGETGSHKDRWAKSAINIVLKKGLKKIVTMSSGNQGLALAAQAKKHKIECVVVTNKEISKEYFPLFKKYSAKLIIANSMRERTNVFKSYVKQKYFPCFLTLNQRKTKETIGIEGYQIISNEIINNLDIFPDIIIIPTSYGDLAKGLLDGFIKLKNNKIIQKLPQFVLLRARSPQGDIAFSISTNTKTKYVKEAIIKTKGKSIFLIDKEFIQAKKQLKKELDIQAEYSSAGTIKALDKLNKKEIEGKTIICILTAKDKKC